jgi:hypothetical protein
VMRKGRTEHIVLQQQINDHRARGLATRSDESDDRSDGSEGMRSRRYCTDQTDRRNARGRSHQSALSLSSLHSRMNGAMNEQRSTTPTQPHHAAGTSPFLHDSRRRVASASQKKKKKLNKEKIQIHVMRACWMGVRGKRAPCGAAFMMFISRVQSYSVQSVRYGIRSASICALLAQKRPS